ncbi:hypothetical protein PVIIG_01794 [Plasmodium vivax India VII]|uniref:Merozoite surface protein 7 (MSP7) n=1 Tax=Plasmodium vivax India VII TaxID=1077284 RepID=A0A0J9S9H1_PLAVI|nr:hypothetical protein PVIIG_01794 [Plasmodium vivax India VII]
MRKNIFLLGSILLFISLHCVSPEKLGLKKKRNSIEGDVLSLLERRLAILYKLSASDKSEIFTKEIESIKKHMNMLKQRGWENMEGNISATLKKGPNREVEKYAGMVGADKGNLIEREMEFFGQEEIKFEGSVDGEEASGDVKRGQAVGGAIARCSREGVHRHAHAKWRTTGGVAKRTIRSSTSWSTRNCGRRGPSSGEAKVKYSDELYDDVLEATNKKDEI